MKVLLVDDHALFREGLRLLLQRMDAGFDVLEAGHVEAALQAMSQHPDLALVLLDLGLPDMAGVDALSLMRTQHPGIPVVVISALQDRPCVLEAINRGAMGFIPKSSDSGLLTHALQLVLAGGVYIPLSALVDAPGAMDTADAASPAGLQAQTERLHALGLSARQIEVLVQMVQGLPNKLIARNLGLSEATVKSHVTATLRALRVANRTQAVLAVGKMGHVFR
jgi:DNA-binding NarL/FixJ family response regulator